MIAERYVARFQDGGRDLVDERFGHRIARVVFARGSGWTAEMDDGQTWNVNAYGRGWKLVAEPVEGGEPLLWYTGRAVRSGGMLELANSRTYDVRSKLLRRLDLTLRDPDGRVLLDVRARPRDDDLEATVEVVAELPHAEDRDLLLTFMTVLALLLRDTASSGGGEVGGP